MLDKQIIQLIETKAGYKITGSSDCARLTLDIESITGERLGQTTLKRLLGFTSEQAEPRKTTMDILARYLGFDSFDLLSDKLKNKGDSSFDSNPETIVSKNLVSNSEITISYSPNRKLTLIHINEDRFEVKESINGSLIKGDILFIESFTPGLPMIAKDVIRNGQRLGRYIAGKKFGISSVSQN